MMCGMSSANTRPARIRKLLMALGAWLLGSFILLVGIAVTVMAIHLDVTGTRTTATILDQRASGRHETYLVSFPLPDGTPLQTWTGAVDGGQSGDTEPVLYDPSDPLDTVASPGYETSQEWVPLLACLVFASGLFMAGRYAWRQSRRVDVTSRGGPAAAA
jgi:hypothetical protein